MRNAAQYARLPLTILKITALWFAMYEKFQKNYLSAQVVL